MPHNISVRCLIDRTWNLTTHEWEGKDIEGTLIDITTQTSPDDKSGDIVPVGIIISATGAFHSVPVEFITKI